MHIYQGHWDAIFLDHVEEEHDAVADFELSNLVVFQHVLQLVRGQAPNAVRVLQAMLRDDLGVKLIELYEVRVSQAEVLEELEALERLILQQGQVGGLPPCRLEENTGRVVLLASVLFPVFVRSRGRQSLCLLREGLLDALNRH